MEMNTARNYDYTDNTHTHAHSPTLIHIFYLPYTDIILKKTSTMGESKQV